jgi:prepilin-type N-terminal cleavage/methylation domain-containing protein
MKTKRTATFPCRREAFTLIELLVVITIMAVLAALAAAFLRSGSSKRMSYLKDLESEAVPAKTYLETGRTAESTLLMHSAVLNMDLRTEYKRGEREIFTRYTCTCTGTVTFSLAAGKSGPMLIAIPFPEDVTEVRDVSMKLTRGNAVVNPEETNFTAAGIFARCERPAAGEDTPITAEIAFTATGQDRFEWELPPAHERRGIQITLAQTGALRFSVPDRSLQPTTTSGNNLKWEFKNVVTSRPIIVELPAAVSPLGRVSTLLHHLAIAVLLFGAGFWYLSEHRQPGRMENFRLGHFLLLTLTFSLFFIVFAVLEFREWPGTAWALVISAVCSLPLLILHVSRIIDMRFAVTRIVPLTLFILVVVLSGVYLPEHFALIATAALAAVIACVTITWRKWAAGRETWQKEKIAKSAAESAEASGVSRRQLLHMTELERAVNEAGVLLEHGQSAELAGRRVRLEAARDESARLAGEYRSLLKDGVKPLDVIHLFQDRIGGPLAELREEVSSFKHALAESRAAVPDAGAEVHCTACGQPGPRSAFCQSCGRLRALTSICRTCKTSLTIPLHLLPERVSPSALHCPACGTKHN